MFEWIFYIKFLLFIIDLVTGRNYLLTGIAVAMAVFLIWCIRHRRMKASQAVALFLLILFLEIVVAFYYFNEKTWREEL